MNNMDLSENERLLLNTLITMYNDNLRQIENLTASNNDIRNTIINTLNELRNRNSTDSTNSTNATNRNSINLANATNRNSLNQNNRMSTRNIINLNDQLINNRHFTNYSNIIDNFIFQPSVLSFQFIVFIIYFFIFCIFKVFTTY